MSDVVEIRAPAEQTEGTRSQILRWLKSVGQEVVADEPLIEIETDKVTVEVAAPGSGTLREILKQEQEEIAPGELLGRIDAIGVGKAPAARSPEANRVDSAATAAVAVSTAGGGAPAAADVGGLPAGQPGQPASLSPAVRRLLAEHGLEPNSVRGSGQGGRITVEDVLQHVRASGVANKPPTQGIRDVQSGGSRPSTVSSPAPSAVEIRGEIHRVPHSAVRKRIAEHMVHSLLHTAPHVTTVFEANLTAVLAHRERHREEFARQGAPLTLTAYFLQAAVTAIRAVPEANSRWTDTALEIFDSVHIGVATALESGLVVPVLHDVHSRDLLQTAEGLNDLVSRAREGRLTPADMRGGTFTISNHGVSGSLIAAPIVINQPQAAILGIGKLERRAIVVEEPSKPEGRIAIEPRCYVTLTIDHRVMDGQQANRFLQVFVQRLESYPA